MADEFYSPLEEYEKARKLGQKQYRASVSAGTYPYLPALDDMLPNEDIVAENYLGVVEIPLDQIVGNQDCRTPVCVFQWIFTAFASEFRVWRKMDQSVSVAA